MHYDHVQRAIGAQRTNNGVVLYHFLALGPWKVECQMARTWQEWLEDVRKTSQMKAEQVGLDTLDGGWGMHPMNGLTTFFRGALAFFALVGVRISGAWRELPAWKQPMLQQFGIGIAVLVTNKSGSKFYLSARQEPGIPETRKNILVGATLQASQANLDNKSKPVPGRRFGEDSRVTWMRLIPDAGRFITFEEGDNANYAKIGVLRLPDAEFDQLATGEEEGVPYYVATREEFDEMTLSSELNAHAHDTRSLLSAL